MVRWLSHAVVSEIADWISPSWISLHYAFEKNQYAALSDGIINASENGAEEPKTKVGIHRQTIKHTTLAEPLSMFQTDTIATITVTTKKS